MPYWNINLAENRYKLCFNNWKELIKISEIIKNIAKRSGGQRRVLIMGLITDELRGIQNFKLNDLESMSNLILSKKSIKEYLKKQKIKVEKLTVGKNTFSLLASEPQFKEKR